MSEIPRERFVGPAHQHEAYADRPVPIGAGQTISQPYVVALMTQELDVRPDHRVLDVGAGSGYQTAILARLAREVFAVERIAELAGGAAAVLEGLGLTNVTLTTGDGTLGWPEHAPYDRIICGAGGPDVPAAWIEQQLRPLDLPLARDVLRERLSNHLLQLPKCQVDRTDALGLLLRAERYKRNRLQRRGFRRVRIRELRKPDRAVLPRPVQPPE